jgi:malate dehydrogenase (quinone)
LGSSTTQAEFTLIGAGIMSATLAMLLKIVRPDASIVVYERLDSAALESSHPWNNAGTGHAALCELHYTPQQPNGEIDVAKALLVNDQFQRSLQFYSWLVDRAIIQAPSSFIGRVPHVGIAWGETDVAFLRARHNALVEHPQFAATAYTEDAATLHDWLPLVMRGRPADQLVAATRHDGGTDVNFGSLSRQIFAALERQGVQMLTGHHVDSIRRDPGQPWQVTVENRSNGEFLTTSSPFVFVGAGGTAIHLLQDSGIPEIKGVGGFPVSGQFLRCTNRELITTHNAKVYGRPATGAPPMTAPHLDTRLMDGKRGLMFGPFAGFTPKFLKQGSWLDFARSIRPDNFLTLLSVARSEIPLTAYLVRQVLQSRNSRVEHMRDFVPEAVTADWEQINAGQRVQIMRPTTNKRGILQFGTEIITASDGSIAGLLGASPGASTSTAIMVQILEKCFPSEFERWKPRLREAIPSLGIRLDDEPGLFAELEQHSFKTLGLDSLDTKVMDPALHP